MRRMSGFDIEAPSPHRYGTPPHERAEPRPRAWPGPETSRPSGRGGPGYVGGMDALRRDGAEPRPRAWDGPETSQATGLPATTVVAATRGGKDDTGGTGTPRRDG
jgi:hypothetical protein